MSCVAPPELNDSQLLAAIDGEASPDIGAHLVRCPYCRSRADSMASIHSGLTARLYRLDCPPADLLGEYQLGLLPSDSNAAVAAHLGQCLHCRGEVAQLVGFLDSLAAELEPSLGERIKVLLARLVRGGTAGGPILGLAPAGVRGGGDETMLYEAGALQIALEIVPAPEEPGRNELLGLLSGGDHVPIVRLLRAGQEVATAMVDAGGNFVFGSLAPGEYELALSVGAVEVQIRELRVP